jgi:hypothetical protein
MLDNIIVGIFVVLLVGGIVGTIADSTTGQAIVGAPDTIDSFSIQSATSFGSLGGPAFFQGETFIVSNFEAINSVTFYFNQSSAWTGAIVAGIYTIGPDNSPTGTISGLAQSSAFTGPLPQNAPPQAVLFTFSTPPVLGAGTYLATYTDNATLASNAVLITQSNAIHQAVSTVTYAGHGRMGGCIFTNGAWQTGCGGSTQNFPFIVIGTQTNPNITGTPGFPILLLLFPLIFIIGVIMGLIKLVPKEGL